MSNKKPSIDGFIPRRSNSQLGERHTTSSKQEAQTSPRRKELVTENDLENNALGTPRPGRTIGRSDIDASLRELDDPAEQKRTGRKLSRRERRRMKKEARTRGQRIRRRIIWAVVALLIAVLVAGAAFMAFKALRATNSVLQGSVADLLQHEPLKEDANGRSNFLILGTSEDDPGHDAGWLTDSIMILSVDQDKKNAYTFSIPRDLYVKYGMACFAGYEGKINGYFSCSNEGEDDAAEQDRLAKTQAFIGSIVGLDIQYGVHVNYTVMRDIVNAIGGSITVNIEGNDGTGPSDKLGIMDSNFDWKCGATRAQRIANCPPNGHFIEYEPGPQVLDAEHALYLAQARGDSAPTYGLAQSNFDRERNQQKILVAIKDKALSAGTLTNLGAITGLIDALGNNLRTNIQTKEVRILMDLAKDIPNESIKSLDFFNADNMIFDTGPVGSAGSSVFPAAGLFNYTALQAYILKELTAEPYMKENAAITVLNGTQVAGVGQSLSDSLTEKGFMVDEVDNAPEGTYAPVEIYQLNTDNPATTAKLQELYGVKVKTTQPPVSVTGETDFVIIIGDASVVQ